jgi:hypothetical protein
MIPPFTLTVQAYQNPQASAAHVLELLYWLNKKTTLKITSINLLQNSALQTCTHTFFVLACTDNS